MKISRSGIWLSLVSSALVVSIGAAAGPNGRSIEPSTAAISRVSDVFAIEREASGKLLAIGRLDSISNSDFVASVLGQKFILLADSAVVKFIERAEVGQAVALFGELVDDHYFVSSGMVLAGGYVQGASKVYLRAHLTSVRRNVGAFSAGALELDASTSSNQSRVSTAMAGSLVTFIGTQPTIAGKVIVEQFARVSSMRRGGVAASVGTGAPNASVGTGRPAASVGTGAPNASVGTGRPAASVGTGSANGR